MKSHKIIIGVIVLICIASGIFLALVYSRNSQRITGTDFGYSYSIEHTPNEPDMWTISTPRVTKFTLSKSAISDWSYEAELQEYKKCVDEIIRLGKSLKWKRVFLSDAEIDKVGKGSSEEAMKILGTRYSYSVYLICKEISRLEDSCEQIFMSLGGSITE